MSPPEQNAILPQGSGDGPASILVADDDPGIRLVLRHRLEAAGYTVEEAGDSQTALEGLLSNRHNVALLDIMMPGAGGT
jgi:CheY-like chemotaxis protein